jgi:hypothetical protein
VRPYHRVDVVRVEQGGVERSDDRLGLIAEDAPARRGYVGETGLVAHRDQIWEHVDECLEIFAGIELAPILVMAQLPACSDMAWERASLGSEPLPVSKGS